MLLLPFREAHVVSVAHDSSKRRHLAVEISTSDCRKSFLVGKQVGVRNQVSGDVDGVSIAGVVSHTAESGVNETIDAILEHDVAQLKAVDG